MFVGKLPGYFCEDLLSLNDSYESVNEQSPTFPQRTFLQCGRKPERRTGLPLTPSNVRFSRWPRTHTNQKVSLHRF